MTTYEEDMPFYYFRWNKLILFLMYHSRYFLLNTIKFRIERLCNNL